MEQFEQLLTCCVCLDRYRNPKLLPCQHSFCMEPCMEGLTDYVRKQVKCPECRAEHRVPYQGIQAFPTNVTLVRFLELHIDITGELPDPNAGQIMERCGVCSEKQYLTACAHCDKKICQDCKSAHMDILRREIGRINSQIKRSMHRLQDAVAIIEKNTINLQANCFSVTEELDEICRRITKTVKDRTDDLRTQVELYLSTELRKLKALKNNLELEIVNISSNCDLGEKHMNENVDWDDCELMDTKEIYLKTVEFIRNFEYENNESSKRIRFFMNKDPNQLVKDIALLGELNFPQIQQAQTSSHLAPPSSMQAGLSRSKSDHRLTQFRPNDDRTYDDEPVLGGRKFGERPVKSSNNSDYDTSSSRYGRSGRGTDDYDDYEPTTRTKRNFRSRFVKSHQNDDVSDNERSGRSGNAAQDAFKNGERVFDTEDVSRGQLSGIIRLQDCSRVILRLQESGKAKKDKKADKPVVTAAPVQPVVRPKPPTPQAATRQVSQEDEISRIKRQNKDTTSAVTTVVTPAEAERPTSDRVTALRQQQQRPIIQSTSEESDSSTPNALQTPAQPAVRKSPQVEADSDSEETDSDDDSSPIQQSKPPQAPSSGTTAAATTTSSAAPKTKVTRTTSTESSESTESSSSGAAPSTTTTTTASTPANRTTNSATNSTAQNNTNRYDNAQTNNTTKAATPAATTAPPEKKPFQSRFLPNHQAAANNAKKPEPETSSESETSSEEDSDDDVNTTKKPSSSTTASTAASGSRTGTTAQSTPAQNSVSSRSSVAPTPAPTADSTSSSRRSSRDDTNARTSAYSSASSYTPRTRAVPAPHHDEPDRYNSTSGSSYTSRFLNRSKSSAVIQPTSSINTSIDDDATGDDSDSRYGTGRSRYLAMKERRSRLARSRSSHALGIDDDDLDDPPVSPTTASPSAYLASRETKPKIKWPKNANPNLYIPNIHKNGYGPSSYATEGSALSRSRSTHALKSRESSPVTTSDRGAASGSAKDGEALSSWARYLKNKYGNRRESTRDAIASSAAPSHATPSSVSSASRRLSLGLPLRQANEYVSSDDDASKNGQGSPTSPTVAAAAGITGLAGTIPKTLYLRKRQQLFQLGGRGSEPGSFTWPRGIAVGPDNSIVVADSSNHRVQVFDSNGIFVKEFGEYGNADGEFDCLAGVAVNRIGQYIIADRYNHRIQVLDPQGRFLRAFGSQGTADGKFSYPWGLTTDSLGFIYVCDKENHRVQVFQSDGTFVGKFGSCGREEGQLEHPHYIAVSNTNRVIVSDSNNHRIQIFDVNGKVLSAFGSEGSEEGQFKFPRGVAVDDQGYICVADSGNNRVQIFNPDGSFLRAFGSWGSGDCEFKGLEGVAIMSNGNVLVCDRENHRVQVF